MPGMAMTSHVRKLVLIGHLVSSLGWIGALLVFLAHALASWGTRDAQVARAAAISMDLSAWFVILPLALSTLVTGVAQALGTPWGLSRHYWVVFKLALTIVATAVLLAKLGPISELARTAAPATSSRPELADLRTSMVLHAIGGLVVLIAAAVLGVFKPEGRIAASLNGRGSSPAPTWVRISIWTLSAFLVAVLLMVLVGKHGPHMHAAPTTSSLGPP